jgi:hypothetical protein
METVNKKDNMKRTLLAVAVVGLLTSAYQLGCAVFSYYTYERYYSNLWELADKSSTIKAKQEYIASFVSSLETGYKEGRFAPYNAVFLETPNNSFEMNLKALKSLAGRLSEIQEMDPQSFQYNTAIQQITGQEQGEAHRMMEVFKGCYDLRNYPAVWEWKAGLLFAFNFITVIIGGLMLLPCWFDW